MLLQMAIVHLFSFYGHLGCFYVLAIVTNAAVNIEVHVIIMNKCL